MMLCFQNLHQLVLNLPQITSAMSSTYVRLISNSVKKKSELDNGSSVDEVLKESENIQNLNDLSEMKFDSSFEDLQWMFRKDLNLKFITRKLVKSDCCYLFNQSDLKCFYLFSVLNELGSGKKKGSLQMQVLANLETHLIEKSRWNESFVSKNSFDENKKSSFCGNFRNKAQFSCSNPLSSSLVDVFVSSSSLSFLFSEQKRGFKTRRSVELDEKNKNAFLSKIVKNFKKQVQDYDVNETKDMILKSPTMKNIISNKAMKTEEKLKLKLSFAEGYIMGTKEIKKPGSLLNKVVKNLLVVMALILLYSLLISVNGPKVFNLSLNPQKEIIAEEIKVNFSDVKGVEEVKSELMEIVNFLQNPSKFSSLGGKLPRGILLVGPPGTGKTLLARAVAGEAKVPFFYASGSEFDELFVGEGAKRVRNIFRIAKEKAPSIIFIDEIDGVGSKRRSTVLHPYANQTINQLLSEMDGFHKNDNVIVIGATNRRVDLDPALLRPGRFDVEVLVPLPDLEGRKEILKLYTSKILSKDLDISGLARATVGCSGADLEAMVNHAAIRAATEKAPYVTMKHMENAKDKILIGPERKLSMKNEEMLVAAYHECGHAIVAWFTKGAGSVEKITIVPRGKTLGHTLCLPDDNYQSTKASYLAALDVALGGRAAEELVFGLNKVTSNCSNDLKKATDLATSMVKYFGMSEKLGLRTLTDSEGEIVTVNQYGRTVSDEIDMEIKKLIQESYERSKNILREHKKEHKLLAEALFKYKTLYPDDVKAILGASYNEKETSSAAMFN